MTHDKTPYTKKGNAFTNLVLEIMRVHGMIRAHGQRLTKPHELTVTRWAVLGAIEKAPLTASQISRRMGVSRQNVQTVVNAMRDERLVELRKNPDHARAPLVAITHKAARRLTALHIDQRVWANEQGSTLALREMTTCLETLKKLFGILDDSL